MLDVVGPARNVSAADTPSGETLTTPRRKLRVLVASHGHPRFAKGGAEIAAYALFEALGSSGECDAWFLGCDSGRSKLASTIAQPFGDNEFVYTSPGADWFNFANRDPRFAPQLESEPYFRVGHEFDFLAVDHGQEPEAWDLIRVLNYLTIQRIKPRQRAAVVTSMRDDGIVLLEWIAHYRAIGFDGIFIYSNDNEDGSTEFLRLLADLGEIIFLENFTSVNHEIKTHEHALQFLIELRDFEWILFVDSDEFFVPRGESEPSVNDIICDAEEKFPRELPAAIMYNWKVFVSGADYARRPALLLERYQYSYAEPHIKSLSRLDAIYSVRRDHVPDIKAKCFCVDSALSPIEHPGPRGQKPPEYSGGQINHYWTRSFEEYSLKKARGDRAPLGAAEFRRTFDHFFEWNAPEREGASSEGWIGFEPPPPFLLHKVKREQTRLLNLPLVRPSVEEVERHFRKLLARHDAEGGLRMIYERARTRCLWAV